MSVEFVDPPPAATPGRRATVVTPEIRAAVKARAGEWARIYVAAPPKTRAAVANYCSRHREWETTCRTVGNDPLRFDVYLRYVGGAV